MNERILWDTIEEQRVCIERLRGEVLAANAAIEAMAVALGKERTANQPAVSRDFITAWANEPGYPERVELLRAEMARLEREATPDPTEGVYAGFRQINDAPPVPPDEPTGISLDEFTRRFIAPTIEVPR